MKAGKTMKQAARSWKAGRSSKKNTSRSGKKTPKKKGGGGGRKLIGNVGLKGIIFGGGMLYIVSRFMPPIGGPYSPAVTKLATGFAASAIGVPGASLKTAGAIEAGATVISQFLGGGLNLPFIGGGSSGRTNGGYML
jgi:hypothetical protein